MSLELLGARSLGGDEPAPSFGPTLPPGWTVDAQGRSLPPTPTPIEITRFPVPAAPKKTAAPAAPAQKTAAAPAKSGGSSFLDTLKSMFSPAPAAAVTPWTPPPPQQTSIVPYVAGGAGLFAILLALILRRSS